MKQKVAYNSSVDIQFSAALIIAKEQFPFINFDAVKTKEDLERTLSSFSETLFVEIDTDNQVKIIQEKEKILEDEVQASLDNFDCPLPPQTFTDEDLKIDLCETPKEFPDEIELDQTELDELEKLLSDTQKQAYGSLEDPSSNINDDAKKALDCVSKMSEISSDMKALIDKESGVRETLINLEEFLYNYRIVDAYFSKKLEIIDQITGTFDPLITKKKDIEAQQAALRPIEIKARLDYSEGKRKLDILDDQKNQLRYQRTNATTQEEIDAAEKAFLDFENVLFQTKEDVNILKANLDVIHSDQDKLRDDFNLTRQAIDFEKIKISPFVDFYLTNDTFADTGRTTYDFLQERLTSLFQTAGANVFSKIQIFTSRTTARENISDFNHPFSFTIQHTMQDVESVLVGKPLFFSRSSIDVTINPYDSSTPSGALYEKLYNIWGDPEKFFTLEERGLTTDGNLVASSLKGTGGESFNSNFIQDQDKFTEFYQNFIAHHIQKVQLIKDTIIEPTLNFATADIQDLAKKEIQYFLAFYGAYDRLSTQAGISGFIQSIRDITATTSKNIVELRETIKIVQGEHSKILDGIKEKKQEFLGVPCAQKYSDPSMKKASETETTPPGSDPLGIKMNELSPDDPNPTKYCYWLKFAAMATAVNILPLPGPGGFKYWPIGLILPSPNGIVKIPLPIIWIPIAEIVLTAGIFVIFIGQCGICPSPVVFFIGANGTKKFIVSLRPGTDFGANAGDSLIKTIDKGGIAIKKSLSSLLNDVKVPNFKPITDPDSDESVISDIKDSILKKIQKLGSPDISSLQRLNTNSTVSDKRKAFKEAAKKHLDNLKIPTQKFPRNSSKVNPKPPPVLEMINKLKKMGEMALPEISIPETAKIDLKDKLLKEISNIDITEIDANISDPGDNSTDVEKNKYVKKIKSSLKKGAESAHSKITPKALGIISTTISTNVVFVNPYKCRPSATGIGVPPMPPDAILALGALKIASDLLIDGLSYKEIKELLKSTSGNLTAAVFPNMLTGVLNALQISEIPDPSKISIKDMLKSSSIKLAKMQMPSIPDPTKGLQLLLPIPGAALKSALLTSVEKTLDTVPIDDINFSTISPIDFKQILIGFVESSFKPLEDVINPVLKITSKYKDAKDKTLPETLGLKKPDTDDSKVATVTKEAMDAAIKALKLLAIVPFVAVAAAPLGFYKLHPILTSDDLPPWKRLTLDNFLFVCFLDEFCKQGKTTSGLATNL